LRTSWIAIAELAAPTIATAAKITRIQDMTSYSRWPRNGLKRSLVPPAQLSRDCGVVVDDRCAYRLSGAGLPNFPHRAA
jgi:hypothetical protein